MMRRFCVLLTLACLLSMPAHALSVVTVGLAFSEGKIGWWDDELQRSFLDNNVYTPEEYPYAWEEYVPEDTPEEVTDA